MSFTGDAGRAFLMLGAALAVLLVAGSASADETIATVTFDCEDGKNIAATFHPDKVDLVLSDGRSLTLPQTMSGSGIRYANADETVVFWSKGDTAFVTEGADQAETYSGCVEAK